jgi:intracellular septation protein
MMMSEKKISQGLKSALDLGPVVLFFLAFFFLKADSYTIGGREYGKFIVVTAMFIPVLFASIGALWYLTGKLSRMQILTMILVLLFGGLSIWFNDERFFKMKPTVIYLIFATMLVIGLLRGQSYLAYVMEDLMPLEEKGWMILTRRFAMFFAFLAVANEYVWRNFETGSWVTFKTFGLPVLLFAFLIAQSGLLITYDPRHRSGDDEDKKDED